MLIKNVHLPGAAGYNTQIEIHTYTVNEEKVLEGNSKNKFLSHRVKIV